MKNRFGLFGIVVLMFLYSAGVQSEPVNQALEQGKSALNEGDVQNTLKSLMEAISNLNQKVEALNSKIDSQGKLIDEQQKTIESQKVVLEEQKKSFEQQKQEWETNPPGVDTYGAILKYEQAQDIQHVAIFDTRRSDRSPYLKKAIERYREVVQQYPSATVADDAQYRIAKIYHRYLNEKENAVAEYKKLVQSYSKSEYIDEAQAALIELGAK